MAKAQFGMALPTVERTKTDVEALYHRQQLVSIQRNERNKREKIKFKIFSLLFLKKIIQNVLSLRCFVVFMEKKQSTKTTGKENNDIWTRNTESFGPVYGC